MRGDALSALLVLASIVAPLHATLTAQDASAGGRVLAASAIEPTAGLMCVVPAGSMRLIGWDRDSIVVRGTGSRKDFILAAQPRGAKLIVEDRQSGEPKPLDLVVYFPRHGKVEVRTVTASITVSDLAGIFSSVSGTIRITGAATSIEADAMDGNLDLDVSVPWLRARTGQGRLLLRGSPQDVDASTVSGALDIATSSVLRGRFASVTGDIRYAAAPAPASLFEFSNHGGAVDFLLPPDASARFDLSSVSGAIENGVLQAHPVATGAHTLRLSLGRGESQLTVRTFKGTIRLRQRDR